MPNTLLDSQIYIYHHKVEVEKKKQLLRENI